jgi:cellulose synthase/poly-beta-1,6-N-acetylglucosamine synthase-like glycosyltransferase
LDDSTDDTVDIAGAAVERMQAAGHNIQYLHRTNREGFKAGALEEGMKSATGEFICIFDADFLPPPGIIMESIHYFTDPGIGMVQARWDHINREYSLLTKTQAVLLDGHFVIEHGARSRSGRFMSFNGTAGIWRAKCIAEAGGWQHDTLTEDLDLSYRAQMKGWKFLFLPEIVSPAELPPDMEAFKAQQRRWAKGGAQTCRKLLPRIMKSKLPWRIKCEAFFHLSCSTVYLYMVLLILLLFPVLWIGATSAHGPQSWASVLVDFSLFLVATCSASSFYACSQRELLRSWSDSLKYLPFLMSLGIGVSLSNAWATFEGYWGKPSEFVRTPKFGVTQSADDSWKRRIAYRQKRRFRLQPCIEIGLGFYMLACVLLCLQTYWVTVGLPFLVLFCVGFFYVGLSTLLAEWITVRSANRATALPAENSAARSIPVEATVSPTHVESAAS